MKAGFISATTALEGLYFVIWIKFKGIKQNFLSKSNFYDTIFLNIFIVIVLSSYNSYNC